MSSNPALSTIFHQSVKVALHERLPRGSQERKGGAVLHASTVTSEGFCPRECALITETGVRPNGSRSSTSLQFTYDIGDLVQSHITAILKDLLWGHWDCGHCENRRRRVAYPGDCSLCGHDYEYREVRFKSPTTSISTGVDLIVKFPGVDKMKVVEVKSIAQDGFRELKAPKAEHRLRTNLMMRVIEEAGSSDLIDCNSALLLYADKGFGCKDSSDLLRKHELFELTSPFKEFIIRRDDTRTEDLCRQAVEVKTHIESGVFPRGICSSVADRRANSCPVRRECFSGNYRAGNR